MTSSTVIRAINEGKQDIADLREVGSYTPLSDEQLAEVVQTVTSEFETARRVLRELLPQAEAAAYPDWSMLRSDLFRRLGPCLRSSAVPGRAGWSGR